VVHTKRCFLALIEGMAKQMITLPDAVVIDIQEFLDACEEHGRTVPTIDQPPLFMDEPFDLGKHTVAYEARYVKALFSKVA